MDLATTEINRILSFYGYGNPLAPVWFIGLEEGLGNMDDGDARKNLKARATFSNVMDLYEAHLRLFENGRPIDIEINPPKTQVWQYMAKIMLARDGHSDWNNRDKVKSYIRHHLGRKNGETFLTELSPIPSRSTSDKRWFAELSKYEPNLVQKIADRSHQLKRLLRESTPSLVICYGAGRHIKNFSSLLETDMSPLDSKVDASADRSRIRLPFLGNGQMNHSIIENLWG